MKYEKLCLPGDTEEQIRQIRDLVDRGHPVRRCSPFHLKILDVNYYFPSERVTVDPHTKQGKGYQQLLKVLRLRHGDIPMCE